MKVSPPNRRTEVRKKKYFLRCWALPIAEAPQALLASDEERLKVRTAFAVPSLKARFNKRPCSDPKGLFNRVRNAPSYSVSELQFHLPKEGFRTVATAGYR